MRNFILTILLLIVTNIAIVAQDKTDMATLYIQYSCPSCHGFYGQGTNIAPRLQNQREVVLLRRLKNLQKGIIRKPNGTVMISFAQSLDENQTKAMAHYLSIMKTSYEIKICMIMMEMILGIHS